MKPELTFAIGDIHGCLLQFETMLLAIEDRAAGAPHRIITLGDYIDRGPDSRGVLEVLMSRPEIIALGGNHELMMTEARNGDFYAIDFWTTNGGKATLASFEAKAPGGILDIYYDWIAARPLHFEDDLRYFVHAGVMPPAPLAKQTELVKRWIREGFLDWTGPFEKYIVHGHTPQVNGVPDLQKYRSNLDTCCFRTGMLTCAVFNNERAEPIEIIQVDGTAAITSTEILVP